MRTITTYRLIKVLLEHNVRTAISASNVFTFRLLASYNNYNTKLDTLDFDILTQEYPQIITMNEDAIHIKEKKTLEDVLQRRLELAKNEQLDNEIWKLWQTL